MRCFEQKQEFILRTEKSEQFATENTTLCIYLHQSVIKNLAINDELFFISEYKISFDGFLIFPSV